MAEQKTVLVISHLASSQMNLGVLMKRMWHFPILSKNAMDGIRICQSSKVDLILLGGNLPNNQLRSDVRLLRTTAATRDIPLVVLLAAGGDDLSQYLLQEGCAAVLTKPIEYSFVYGLLNRIMAQSRATPRIPLRLRVAVEEGFPEKFLTSVDISEGGIYLRTLEPLPEGTVVHLIFFLPHNEDPVRLPAEVVRAFRLGDRLDREPGMGLRFLEVSDAVRAEMRNYIHWEMTGDLEWEPKLPAA